MPKYSNMKAALEVLSICKGGVKRAWYYIDSEGKEIGPISSAEFKKLTTLGVILRSTSIRPENRKSYCPAVKVQGLFPPKTDVPPENQEVSSPPDLPESSDFTNTLEHSSLWRDCLSGNFGKRFGTSSIGTSPHRIPSVRVSKKTDEKNDKDEQKELEEQGKKALAGILGYIALFLIFYFLISQFVSCEAERSYRDIKSKVESGYYD